MATVASGLNSGAGYNDSDTITSTTLNNHVNNATVTGIVNADVASNAAVAFTKLAALSSQNLLANTGSGNASIPIVGATGLLLDEDTMSTNSATKGATQQSIKAYVDDSALKETILVYNSATIDIPDKDSSANGVQVPLEFEHLRDSAESDPDTAGTDINDAGISLSSNEFTLTEGTYDIEVKSVVSMNTFSSGGPGLHVAGFVKRKSDDVKILISNVAENSDDISSRTTAHCFIKGRIVVPSTPSSNTNVFDLRFYKDNNGTALVGSTYASGFIGDPNPPQVFISIKKVKA
jgi:hypothetical protein